MDDVEYGQVIMLDNCMIRFIQFLGVYVGIGPLIGGRYQISYLAGVSYQFRPVSYVMVLTETEAMT